MKGDVDTTQHSKVRTWLIGDFDYRLLCTVGDGCVAHLSLFTIWQWSHYGAYSLHRPNGCATAAGYIMHHW